MVLEEDTLLQPFHYIRLFINVAETIGLDKKLLLEQSQISNLELSTPYRYISYKFYKRFYKAAADLSADPTFFLKFGRSLHIALQDRVGHAMQQGNSLESAFRNVNQYICIYSRNYDVNLVLGDQVAELVVTSNTQDSDVYRYEIEQFMSGMLSIIRSFPGGGECVQSISISYSKPSHYAEYSDYLGSNCQFDSDINKIEFLYKKPQRLWLNSDLWLGGDSRHASTGTQRNNVTGDWDLRSRIKLTIENYPNGFPKQYEVAEKLGMPVRTISRSLKKLNTSYQDIAKEVRFKKAKTYLDSTSFSIEEISEMLGYSCINNFSRAFKRYTGVSPASFRQDKVKGEFLKF